jgi:UDP-glucose 4-epimerase
MNTTAHTILLTGATGYIGSHTWIALREAGFQVVGLDNFANSSPKVLARLETLLEEPPIFVEGDVNDTELMTRVIAEHRIDGVIHFAAHKAVGESNEKPLEYFRNNLGGLVSVSEAMRRNGVRNLVFSSSATVYGQPERLPIREDAALSCTNPYGMTKLLGEQMLREVERCDPVWKIAYLRYFNPVGAHPSGLIGEDPRGVPNNLMPYVAQVAVGKRPQLLVFGGDYATHDGTGVRDFIHVVDLAEGHVAALRYLLGQKHSVTVNLGTGQGYSVLDVIGAFERASGRRVPYKITDRRAGDIGACYADPGLALTLLGWKARRGLDTMCEDAWRWQSKNPSGFEPV